MFSTRFRLQLALVALALMLEVMPSHAQQNLMPTGDFEGPASAGGLPAGWTMDRGTPGTVLHLDTDVKVSGRASLRFDFTPANQTAWISEKVSDIHPDTEYKLSGFIKTSAGAQLRLELNVELNLGGRDLPAPTEWTPWEWSFNSQEATSMSVGFRFQGTGTVWMDNLRLVQVGEAGASVLPERKELLRLLEYQSHPVDPAENTDEWTRPYRSVRDPAAVFHLQQPAPAWKIGQWARYLCRDQLLVPSSRPEKRPEISLIDCAIVGQERIGGKIYYWYQSVVRLERYWVSRSNGNYDSGQKILLAKKRKIVLSLLVDGPDFRDIRRYQLKVDDEPLLEYASGGRAVLPQLNIDNALIRPVAGPTAARRSVAGPEVLALLPQRPALGPPPALVPAASVNPLYAEVPVTGLLRFDYHGPQLDRSAVLANWGDRGSRDERGGETPVVLHLPSPPYIGVSFDGFGDLSQCREIAAAGADMFQSQGVIYLGEARRFFNQAPVYFYNDHLWDLDPFDVCRSNLLGFSEMLDEPYQRQRKLHEYVKPTEAATMAEAAEHFSQALSRGVQRQAIWPGQSVMDYDSPASASWYAARAGCAGFVMENDRLTQQMEDVQRVTGKKDARELVDEINIAFLAGAARRFGGWWGQGIYRWSPSQYYQEELAYFAERGASYTGFWIEGGPGHKDPDLTFYHQVVKLLPAISKAVHFATPHPRHPTAVIVVPNGYVVGLAGAPPNEPFGIVAEPRGQAITDNLIAHAAELFDKGIQFDIIVDDPRYPPVAEKYSQIIRIDSPHVPGSNSAKGYTLQ